MNGQQEIRMDVLQRLAEQAMSDPDFRAVARHDLMAALLQYGYDLNERERELVFDFRATLEEAGIDLFPRRKTRPRGRRPTSAKPSTFRASRTTTRNTRRGHNSNASTHKFA